MRDAPESTRSRIVDAAEQLFAERGIEVVSLREIGRAVGLRNDGAVQYHFRDRKGLVEAIYAKHRPMIEARRHALLDAYEAAGIREIRPLAAASVRPMSAELDNPEGGPAFLRVYAQAMNEVRPFTDVFIAEYPSGSGYRWKRLLEQVMDPRLVRMHRRLASSRMMANELSARARAGGGASPLFVAHLVDQVAAILSAPLSEETLRALDAQISAEAEASAVATPKPRSRSRSKQAELSSHKGK